jgi:hypothetical protein
VKKIKDVLGDIYERYPQVELYLKSNQMKGFHDLLKDSDGSSKELNWISNSSKRPWLKWTLKSRCSQQQLRYSCVALEAS